MNPCIRHALALFLTCLWLLQPLSASGDPPKGTAGKLIVTSEPVSARVYVDGRFYGMTPAEVPIDAGEHVLRVLRDGYLIEQRTVRVEPGDEREIPIRLEPAAYLVVRSVPGGADIVVDGEVVGETPSRVPVRPGMRAIEVRKRGHEAWERELRLQIGDRYSIEADLPYLYGRLEVLSVPQGASVYVDDEYRGEAAPLVLEEVPPGLHRLRLALPTYEDALRDIMVERGESVSVLERLTHTLAYIEEERAEREARNNVIRKGLRFTTLTVGVASAIYATTVHRDLKDQESKYNRVAFTDPALGYREEIQDLEAKRNLWAGVSSLTLSVGLMTFVF